MFLNWICDYCGKMTITTSLAGIFYCQNCRMSYGEDWADMVIKILQDRRKEVIING